MSPPTLAEAAARYAGRSWHVFPLLPRSKKPRYAGGFHTATADGEQVRAWWGRNPDDNIGLAPGRSRLIAFDDDTPDAHAVAQFLGLLSEPTLVVATGRGAHLYFRRPDFPVGNLWLGGTLLVRCDDGYTVLPPSVHPDTGRAYRYEMRTAPLPLPPRALEAIRTATTSRQRLGRPAKEIPALAAIPEGQRHEAMKSAAGRLVAVTRGRMERAELWGWLSALNQARCRPAIEDEQLAGMLDYALGHESAKAAAPTSPAALPRARRRASALAGPPLPHQLGLVRPITAVR